MKTSPYTRRVVKATRAVALGIALFALIAPAYALNIAGVQYQASTQVASRTLLLNGAGVRQQDTSGLYTAGLYLERKAATQQDVVSGDGAKQLRLVMLRDISAKKLSELMTQRLIANATDEALAPLISEMFNVGLMLSEQGRLLMGDTFQIDNDPVGGTTITIRGSGRGMPVSKTFAHPDLFKVMMGIWLGERPADTGLKNALLGQPL